MPLMLLLGACAVTDPAAAPATDQPSGTGPSATPAGAGVSGKSERDASVPTPNIAYPPPVEAAREAFAAASGVEPEAVVVVSYEAVVWNDSSLGCGRPGEMYMQVLTPGYRVTLEANGEQAVYHTDRNDPPARVRCNRPVDPRYQAPSAPGTDDQ